MESETLYIETNYVHRFSKDYRWDPLLIVLYPPEHGFSFAKSTIDGSIPWDNCHFDFEDRLGGWMKYSPAARELFMLYNGHEELFVLEVKASAKANKHTRLKIYIPRGRSEIESLKERTTNVEALRAIFDETRPTDRLYEQCLQAGTVLSIEIRRKLAFGIVLNVMEIKFSPVKESTVGDPSTVKR